MISNIKDEIEKIQIKNHSDFKVGDIICINFKIVDNENKKKNQNFEGLVIAIKKNKINTTCTVRKISHGEGVEKTFFLMSPNINWIQIKKHNKVRLSKLYYIRYRKSKLMK